MANVLARIGIYGDMHLSSKNYGAHRDYPNESLEYFHNITEITQRRQLTHLIGTGDFTFGRFHSLEYRSAIENELQTQYTLTNGNRYELRGNHDEAGYGMTERDYYVTKGLLKPSCNLTIGNLYITMVDYEKEDDTIPNIIDSDNAINLLIAHNYFKFSNTQLPNFGKAIDLDNYTKWFGLDYLACGHIHKDMEFDGNIIKDDMAHQVHVNYLGCMMRPAYRDGMMDEKGKVLIITLFDDGMMDVDTEYVQLWSLDRSFNLEQKAKQATKKEEKAARVDISDIVKQLDTHDRNVGSPEDIINGLEGVDDKYKSKAISLLNMALA